MIYIVEDDECNEVMRSQFEEEVKDFTFNTDYNYRSVPTCRHKDCEKEGEPYSDFHGIFTGNYCDFHYENNYPYRKDDYMEGQSTSPIDGTSLE